MTLKFFLPIFLPATKKYTTIFFQYWRTTTTFTFLPFSSHTKNLTIFFSHRQKHRSSFSITRWGLQHGRKYTHTFGLHLYLNGHFWITTYIEQDRNQTRATDLKTLGSALKRLTGKTFDPRRPRTHTLQDQTSNIRGSGITTLGAARDATLNKTQTIIKQEEARSEEGEVERVGINNEKEGNGEKIERRWKERKSGGKDLEEKGRRKEWKERVKKIEET